ncbi:hypothetical protein ACFQZ4_48075 [Catellatospora coxensis]
MFSAAERCIPGGGVDCDPQDLNADTAASWPDVPQDLLCAAGVHCDQNQTSATYFTRKRLAKVQTEIRGASGWAPVESWTLEHEFKVNDDNSRTLWLKKIGHTGHQGATPQSLPAVELDGIQLANRIDRDDDDFGPLIRYRLASVKTDSGAQITVNYQAPDCTKEAVPSAGNSTGRCYPVIWNPWAAVRRTRSPTGSTSTWCTTSSSTTWSAATTTWSLRTSTSALRRGARPNLTASPRLRI